MTRDFPERILLGKSYAAYLTCAELNAWHQYMNTDPNAIRISSELDYAAYKQQMVYNDATVTKRKYMSVRRNFIEKQLTFIKLTEEWVKNNVGKEVQKEV